MYYVQINENHREEHFLSNPNLDPNLILLPQDYLSIILRLEISGLASDYRS